MPAVNGWSRQVGIVGAGAGERQGPRAGSTSNLSYNVQVSTNEQNETL